MSNLTRRDALRATKQQKLTLNEWHAVAWLSGVIPMALIALIEALI